MKLREFQIGDGHITFSENEIIIDDKSRRTNIMMVISSCLWLIFSVFSILRYHRTNEEFHLWVGLLIGIGHLLILGILFFRSTKSKVSLDEIKEISFKTRNGRDFLDIKLNNGRTRRVIQINPIVGELKEYLTQNQLI